MVMAQGIGKVLGRNGRFRVNSGRSRSGDPALVEVVGGHFQENGRTVGEFRLCIGEGLGKVAEYHLPVHKLDAIEDLALSFEDGSGGFDGGF